MVVYFGLVGVLVASFAGESRIAGPRVPNRQPPGVVMEADVPKAVAIVLAGGVGSRMKADRPKQLLDLDGKTVMEHSIELFLTLPTISKVVVVLDVQYREHLDKLKEVHGTRLVFADPGKERQDSVFNGMMAMDGEVDLVCIHDAARPLVTAEKVEEVMADGFLHGAAVLAVPCKATIKESADGEFVLRTLERRRLWEIQTPQVIKVDLLKKGFEKVHEEELDVTDDASIVEALGLPVKLTVGEYTNLKITTPEDMAIARDLLGKTTA